MQETLHPRTTESDAAVTHVAEVVATAPGKYRVVRRNGKVTVFDESKIKIAITKAFLAVEGGNAAASRRIHETVDSLTRKAVYALTRSQPPDGGIFHIEDIQDHVELALMRDGHHKVARSYVIYREGRTKERAGGEESASRRTVSADRHEDIMIVLPDKSHKPLDMARLETIVGEACDDTAGVSRQPVIKEALRNMYSGMAAEDVSTVLIMGARTLIEKEPAYSFVSAALLLDKLRREALSFLSGRFEEATSEEMGARYPEYFKQYIARAGELKLLDSRLCDGYDVDKLAHAIRPERDRQFTYLGLQTLYDRYFLHTGDVRLELPQAFFMRVAMGLANNEIEREQRAIEFYELLSGFDFMSSTPTLFNSMTPHPQLSSCYLTTVSDDLRGIFESIQDNAMLSKFAGGLGNDWTRVRAIGSPIKGTNGKSQGVVPFLKVANDTAVAVNQGGKRKGAVCAYLETWHLDIEEFLELRKNTGDDRRRTHDMNTANWVPDLFMQRVARDQEWTLFSPNDTPDLHDLYGKAFEARYREYEALADEGGITNFRRVEAVALWRKMLNMLYETGHPWIAFKDNCNLRSPQSHVGVVHSSNLCTEITLNTSGDEIAVCNLGSINLAAHVDENGLMLDKLEKTVTTAMRMLDNVIDYNYYSVPEARASNRRHRPVGLGLMGFQDALYKLRIPYADERAVEFADRSMEAVSYFAIQASNQLAKERGKYSSFDGSLWSKGILPIDSIELLVRARDDGYIDVNTDATFDWNSLRESVKKYGLRNSNTMAIAPTATISNICGVTQSIEPAFQNLFVKSNLSGEFTVINPHLADDLKKRGLWDEVMTNDLKYYDGSVQHIDRVPDDLKRLYATAFEIEPRWLVEAASRRQKWIDQSQSLNLYMNEPSGTQMNELYNLAWVKGLKTTYYLRSKAATHVEKSTMEEVSSELNVVKATGNGDYSGVRACSTLDPECEACQ